MLLIIDNYDSFTYNLYQLLGELTTQKIKVIKNDETTVAKILKLKPSGIVLSPGPGEPKNAGITEDVVRYLSGKQPILGVCLGHQAICEVYGAKITAAKKLMHGKTSSIKLTAKSKLFSKCPISFQAARYHSLAAIGLKNTTLTLVADTEDNEIMAVSDERKQVFGVQFHPESIMTDSKVARQILQNFIEMTRKVEAAK